MPKFEVTINGVRTQMYTFTTLIDAKDEEDALEKGEFIIPDQKDWVAASYDDPADNEIDPDGVDEVIEITDFEQPKVANEEPSAIRYER